MTSLHGQTARLKQPERGVTMHPFFPVRSPEEVSNEADLAIHGARITTKSLTSSVEAFSDFISPTSKTDGPFLCVFTVHSSVSGTLKLRITFLFTCLLLLPSRTWAVSTHSVFPVPRTMIGS